MRRRRHGRVATHENGGADHEGAAPLLVAYPNNNRYGIPLKKNVWAWLPNHHESLKVINFNFEIKMFKDLNVEWATLG